MAEPTKMQDWIKRKSVLFNESSEELTVKKVVLITGASSGIGLATVKKLVEDDHVVYGTARKVDDLKTIEKAGAKTVTMEMTDYKTIEKAVDQLIKDEGRIDVLVNNAGYGLYGSVEETPIEDAKHQFDVNLFGLARLTQLVLPIMRKQKSGTIINISSMGGKIYTPLGSWYHATKHALEGWSDCLRLEVKNFGIEVVIVEPGGIQTDWGATAADNLMRISSEGPYKEFGIKAARGMRRIYSEEKSLSPPSVIADVIAKAIASKKPKTRYVAGKYARLLLFLRKWFSDKLFDKIILRGN